MCVCVLYHFYDFLVLDIFLFLFFICLRLFFKFISFLQFPQSRSFFVSECRDVIPHFDISVGFLLFDWYGFCKIFKFLL